MESISALPYRKKNRLILALLPVTLLLLWFMLFSRTANLYKENKKLSEQIQKASNAPEKMAVLSEKLDIANRRLGAYHADSAKSREQLLLVVSNFCHKNNIILKEFPQVYLENNKGLLLETNKIVAEGNFRDLLKMLYELEQVEHLGRPASVSFIKSYDNKRKREVLTVYIYLQTITIKEEKNEAL